MIPIIILLFVILVGAYTKPVLLIKMKISGARRVLGSCLIIGSVAAKVKITSSSQLKVSHMSLILKTTTASHQILSMTLCVPTLVQPLPL